MGGRIVIGNGAIAGAGDDFAIQRQGRADRRLAPRGGGARLGEGAIPRVENIFEIAVEPLPHVVLFPRQSYIQRQEA